MALIHPFRKLVQHWMLAKHETVVLVWLKSPQEFPSALDCGNGIIGIFHLETSGLVLNKGEVNIHFTRVTISYSVGRG